jgi:hypothetical protein|tara:strand:+ start:721 stop:2091 length:1371 start_codon:yes stop_codon:yes gene_type:complete
MKTILLIILAIVAVAVVVVLLLCKNKESFTQDIFDLRNAEKTDIIDFNYGEYSYATTSIESDPTLDPTSQPMLAAFCFKSQGLLKEEWKSEYNNPLDIIKKEIPIRTSPDIHNITGLVNRKTIYNAIKADLEKFKATTKLYNLVEKISPNKDENKNFIVENVIAGPVYAIFIHHPYYIENNTSTSKMVYKDIYFNNKNSLDFTPSYAIYNDGIFDTKLNTDANSHNVKTQLLLLYPLYNKTTDNLYQGKCDYYNMEQDGVDTKNNIKIKGNPSLVFKQKPCISGISEMLRYFKSGSYYQDLLYCPVDNQPCNDTNLQPFTFKFKLSNDANCFIRCKGSLPNANTDIKVVCGCASQFMEETALEAFDVPDDHKYDTKCKSNFNTKEIEDDKYYIYGFAYRINEELVVNEEISRITLTQNDIKKLNDAINPTRIIEKDKTYLKLENKCNIETVVDEYK